MTLYENVKVFRISETGKSELRFPDPVTLRVDYDPQGLLLSFLKGTYHDGHTFKFDVIDYDD